VLLNKTFVLEIAVIVQLPRRSSVLWKPKVHYHSLKSLSFTSILRQMNPFHVLTSYSFRCILVFFSSLHLNIVTRVLHSILY